jgi:cytochrome bd-type quinol oxidase subunit 2
MSQRISVPACQRRLAAVWFLGGGLVFAILVIQTFTGHYGDQARDAWGWFLPTVMPILTLIASAAAVTGARSSVRVDALAYHISLGLSVFYLLLVIATIGYQVFTSLAPAEMIDLMKTSNLWLGPVQTLLGISLGVFFGTRQHQPDAGE